MDRKRILAQIGLFMLLLLLIGCSEPTDSLERIKDLEFTVLAEDNIPDELKKIIDEKKINPFKVTYQDNGFLYICVGYGQQVSGGYSITVNDLYLTENAVYADTSLLGPKPSQGDALGRNSPSFPYVVIKMEYMDKPVVFD